MTDPLKKYVLTKLTEEFQEKLDRLMVHYLDLIAKAGGGPSPFVISNLAKRMMGGMLNLILMTHPRPPIDTSNNEAMNAYISRMVAKYLTIISNEIDPAGWEDFKKRFPEEAKKVQELIDG